MNEEKIWAGRRQISFPFDVWLMLKMDTPASGSFCWHRLTKKKKLLTSADKRVESADIRWRKTNLLTRKKFMKYKTLRKCWQRSNLLTSADENQICWHMLMKIISADICWWKSNLMTLAEPCQLIGCNTFPKKLTSRWRVIGWRNTSFYCIEFKCQNVLWPDFPVGSFIIGHSLSSDETALATTALSHYGFRNKGIYRDSNVLWMLGSLGFSPPPDNPPLGAICFVVSYLRQLIWPCKQCQKQPLPGGGGNAVDRATSAPRQAVLSNNWDEFGL